MITKGTPAALTDDPGSMIGPFLDPEVKRLLRKRTAKDKLFDLGEIRLETDGIHTVKALESGTVILEVKDGPYAPMGPEDVIA